MPGTRRSHRSRRTKKSARWIVLAIVLCSCMSCLAPVLYASTDCSRWLAEYKQGILQRRATRRLRLAKYRLTAMLHKPEPVHRYPMRHRMGPLESLHRFQIDCGDLTDTPAPPTNEAVIPALPVLPRFDPISFGESAPDLPPPDQPVLTAEVPSLINVPTSPVENLPAPLLPANLSPAVTPEPASFVFVLTGVAGLELLRRRAKNAKVLAQAV